ncbi:MAG: hypothetical protein AAFQ06_05895, partial [Pseudomonadota bacterium]
MPLSRRLALALAMLVALLAAPVLAQDQGALVPMIEVAEEQRGMWDRWTDFLVDFQRRANAEVAT